MNCLPIIHVEWEVRRPIEETLTLVESQLCKEPWWMMDQEARINIELSFKTQCWCSCCHCEGEALRAKYLHFLIIPTKLLDALILL